MYNCITESFIITSTGCSTLAKLEVFGVAGGGAVVNGSSPLVVMDCHYTIPQGQEAGLVVKWYKDSNPRPVYQWIYGSKPQVGFQEISLVDPISNEFGYKPSVAQEHNVIREKVNKMCIYLDD